MDLDEAIRKSVKSFYDGADFDSYKKVKGTDSLKYSKDFFDSYESDLKKKSKKTKKVEEE